MLQFYATISKIVVCIYPTIFMWQLHCDFQCYQFGVAPLFSCDSVFQTTMCTGHAKLSYKQYYIFIGQFIRQFYTTILYYNFENCRINLSDNLSDSLDRYTVMCWIKRSICLLKQISYIEIMVVLLLLLLLLLVVDLEVKTSRIPLL